MPFTLATHADDAHCCTRARSGAPRGVRIGASARGGAAGVGRRWLLTALGAVLLLLGGASWQDAQAQSAGHDRREAIGAAPASADTRWTPWLGCWELVDDRFDGDSPAADEDDGVARPSPGARVCIAPSGFSAGVVRRTLVDGRTVVEERVAADGQSRSFGVPACTGTERAEWSATGLRLLTTAEMRCEGQPRWRASGISLIVPGPRWMDVQLIEEAGRRSVRVRRYRPASSEAAPRDPAPSAAGDEPGRRAATAPLALSEVAELTAKVPMEVLQAVLLEARPTFALTANRLVELRRADVPPAVIDLMVALSFPQHFAVDRASSRRASPGPMVGWYDPYGWILPYSAFVSPLWAAGAGEWYVLDGGDWSGPSEEPRGRGRVVDGRGYTRVRPVETGAAARRSGGGGGTGSTGSTDSTSSGSSSSGSSGGVSSSGYSSGSSGDGARTAVPR
jgi:hypothetical protein